jgi:methylated-DNA-[protein]-cysteine S-methyltransferase
MAHEGLRLFGTPLGDCALTWNALGLTGVWLPEATADATRARVQRRHPAADEQAELPAMVQATIEGLQALLSGQPDPLDVAVLDLSGTPEFEQLAWAAARTIRPGCTLTYGELAQRLGQPGAARAVGRAMARNRFPLVVPCHRVLATGGGAGGFSAPGGTVTKLRLLQIEGARIGSEPSLF